MGLACCTWENLEEVKELLTTVMTVIGASMKLVGFEKGGKAGGHGVEDFV